MRPSSIDASVLVSLFLVAGCLPKPHADATRYYILTASAPASPRASAPRSAPSPEQTSLGLGPVDLPGYLDRSELVSRPSANQLRLAEEERWGEPLVDGFRRILRHDLQELLDTNRIVQHPFDVRSPPALVIVVDVSRFEPVGTVARNAELVASWTLSTGRESRVLARAQTTVREPIARNSGRGAEIAALSRALARFASALASAVRTAENQEATAQRK